MSTRSGEVWVFAEQEEGRLSDVPIELLGKGRSLADRLGVRLSAVLIGAPGAESLARRLLEAGADQVRLAEDPAFAAYRGAAYRPMLESMIRECQPQIVIFGATHIGRDLAPAVASALRTGLTADCTDLQIGDYVDKKTGEEFRDVLLQIRPAFGGNIIATIVNARHLPQMATVREGVMQPLTPPRKIGDEDVSGGVLRHEVPAAVAAALADLPVEIVEIVRKASSVNLKGARVIVAGGAGMGSRENFALLHELASALGGAVGGSRAAVDLGYCEHDRQIGQTGVTVRPALMISCGISGAVQHLAGMKDSAKIIAINSDPSAPIFSVAHYGIVGDACEVLPRLIRAVRTKAS